MASILLICSPMAAHAKGGGHGGGGHSSSHSSSYHSSSRRVLHQYQPQRLSSRRSRSRQRNSGYSSSGYRSSSVASSPPPPPVTLFPDESAARREGGYFCPANLPQPGERVDVLGEPIEADSIVNPKRRTATVISNQPASQESLYGTSDSLLLQPVPGFESDCSVTVQYDDGTIDIVSAAQKPKSIIEELTPLLAYGVYGALYLADDASSTDSWETAMESHEALLEELQAASKDHAARSDEVPPSGDYWGSSEESDGGDQAVRCSITFHHDGSITGRGKDDVDGYYHISSGRWGLLNGESRPTLVWIEKYNGFQVAVLGHFDARDGNIRAHFTSSRGIGGSFVLAPKPSVF